MFVIAKYMMLIGNEFKYNYKIIPEHHFLFQLTAQKQNKTLKRIDKYFFTSVRGFLKEDYNFDLTEDIVKQYEINFNQNSSTMFSMIYCTFKTEQQAKAFLNNIIYPCQIYSALVGS